MKSLLALLLFVSTSAFAQQGPTPVGTADPFPAYHQQLNTQCNNFGYNITGAMVCVGDVILSALEYVAFRGTQPGQINSPPQGQGRRIDFYNGSSQCNGAVSGSVTLTGNVQADSQTCKMKSDVAGNPTIYSIKSNGNCTVASGSFYSVCVGAI